MLLFTQNHAPVLTRLMQLRFFFIKYGHAVFNVRKIKNRKVMEAADSALTLNTSSGSELRRYTRRFYRRVLNKRYEKNISLINGNYANWSSSLLYRTPMQKSVNFKAFFHIKVFFNLDEFLLYDFYNFHKSLLSVNFKDAEIPDKFIPKKP